MVRRFLTSLLKSLSSSNEEWPSVSLQKGLVLLAVPMMAGLMFDCLYSIANLFWLARLGPQIVACVGLTDTLLSVVVAIGLGLSMGASAKVSRRVGEGDKLRASIASIESILLCIVIGFVLSAIGITMSPRLLQFMGASPELVRMGTNYAVVAFAGCALELLFMVNGAILRGAGDPAIALKFLVVSSGVCLILDPMLIFGLGPIPKLGIIGSAVAVIIGKSIGIGFQFHYLLRGTGVVRLTSTHFNLDWNQWIKGCGISVSAIFNLLIMSISWILLMQIVSIFGDDTIAGYTIASRILLLVLLPSLGLTNAVAVLVGQNLGAQRPDRAEKVTWKACKYNMAFLTIAGVVIIALARDLLLCFSTESKVVVQGAAFLRMLSLGNIAFSYGMCVLQGLSGAGDNVTPLLISLVGLGALEIPMAYLLSVPVGLGPFGISLAIVIAELLMGLVSVVIFRQGRWKIRQI